VIRELGARCAAEQDFVGLASYLTGMGHGVELRHLRYFIAVAEEGSFTNDRSTLSCPTFTPKHNP
jgi:LysR family transcriptional regulator, hca operon transcriptional activator